MKKQIDMQKIKNLTFTAMFLSLIIVMSFTPIGYLHIGTVEISLLSIPVAAGASVLGIGGGAFLGLAFGLSSLLQCFGMSTFGTTLFGINPFYTVIMCIVPRVLMGIGSALVYKFLKGKNKALASALSFLTAAILNTVLFVGLFILLFSNTAFYSGLEQQFAVNSVIAFFAAFVGLNGIIEAVASTFVGAALGKAGLWKISN